MRWFALVNLRVEKQRPGGEGEEREREIHRPRYCCLPITSDNGSISGSRTEIVPRSVGGRQYAHRYVSIYSPSLRGRNFGCHRRHQDGNRKLDNLIHTAIVAVATIP